MRRIVLSLLVAAGLLGAASPTAARAAQAAGHGTGQGGDGPGAQLPAGDGALADLLGPEFSVLDWPSSLGAGGVGALLDQPLPGREAPGGSPTDLPGTGEFRLSATNRLDFHARDVEVADAFAQLRSLVQRNIVLAPGVAARFTGDLYDLDVDETIDAICRSTGLVARYEGSFIFVEPDEQTSRIFELQYVRGEDLVQLVTPLLSETGKVSATVPPEVGITDNNQQASGDGYAMRDILLVHDFPGVLDAVAEVVEVLDVRPKQVLIEATIMSAALTDDFSAGIDFTILKGVNWEDIGATSTDGTSVDIGGYTPEQLADGAGTSNSNLTDLLPSGGLNIGYLNHGVGIFIKALQQLTDTTILANPRVVALNKQRGEVLLGRRDGYLTSIVTQTSTTQRVEFLETGTRLVFRPFVGEDGFVRLEIHPEDSDGGVNAEGLPFKDTAEVTTNVLVRSGQTIVIGGLFRERVQSIEKKVPWLGDIWMVGNLFRSTQEIAGREEIIVMLTPHVLDPGEDTEGLAGTAGGLVRTGALAGTYTYTARSLADAGDLGGSLMFLEASRGLDPFRAELPGLKLDAVDRLVPAFADRAVDARIMDQVFRWPGQGPRPVGDGEPPADGETTIRWGSDR